MEGKAPSGVQVTARIAPASVRLEDRRLVCGEGRYVANLDVPAGALHAAIVRSASPHGILRAIDTASAEAVPGVVAVLTAAELGGVLDPLPSLVGTGPSYLPIAVERVRYVGEPVAVVLAEDEVALSDAVDLVDARIESIPHVVETLAACADDAPLLDADHGSNVVWERTYRYGDPDAAFAAADRIVRTTLRFPRYNSTPLETYGVIARWSSADQAFDVTTNFQGPFSLFPVLARALKVPEHRLRLKVPRDVGGSFGIKAMVYPYVALIAACSRVVRRPVVWIEGRSEHLMGSTSGTERVSAVEAAVRHDGRIEAIRTDIVEDVGAYFRAPEPACVMRSLTLFSGPYDIGHGETRARIVLTNRVPTGLTRGYGGQQHCFTIERLVDAVAAEIGLDPVEVRRRNLLTADRFPHETSSGTIYDSGDYHQCLDTALELAGYAAVRAEQARRREAGEHELLGIGVATIVHSSAANIGYVTLALDPAEREAPGYRPKSGAQDVAEVSLGPTGRVRVRIATAGAGQGHATTAAQIAAGELGLTIADVDVDDVVDTADGFWGTTSGSYSSRFTVVVGGAVKRAAAELRARLVELAASVLEADPTDLDVADGRVFARDAPTRAVGLRQLAGMVQWDRGSLPGDARTDLVASAAYSPPNLGPPDGQDRINAASTYGFMADVVVVEVDTATGAVKVKDYVAVHDVGLAVNPALVAGQIHGGILHGVAGAMFEHTDYAADGQPTGTSLLTYLCPSAAEMPSFKIVHVDSPSPFSELGAKGCGENSAMSAPAAVAAAVEDALAHLGVRVTELPVTPERVWRMIHLDREGCL